MDLQQVVQDFYDSAEKYLFLKLESNDHEEVRNLVKTYKSPRMIARTKYKASRVEIKCRECYSWNNIHSGKLIPGGYIDLPGDYSVKCIKCGELIYFCNEYDSLADYKDWGDIRCLSYKPTKKIVIIKEPFEYPGVYYNESYRKWNRNAKSKEYL